MKLSTRTIQQQPVKAMLEQQEALNKVQRQLASGKSILIPSDDPSGMARANQLRDSMNRANQYIRNGGAAEVRLSMEESVLSSLVNSLQRARELSIQALNDSNNIDDRKNIGKEISNLFEEIVGMANTRGENGEFIFSGFQGDTEPFSYTTSIASTISSQLNIGTPLAASSAGVGSNGVVADTLRFAGDVSAEINIADNETAVSIVGKVNADASLAAAGITATASNSVAITIPNGAQTYATGFGFSVNGNAVGPIDFTGAADLNTMAAAIQAADGTLTATVNGPDIIVTNATGEDIRIEDVTDGLVANTNGVMKVNGHSLDELGSNTSNDSINIGGTISFNSAGSIDYQIASDIPRNVMRGLLSQTEVFSLTYNGDSGQRDIKIGDSVKLQMNDTGDELFVNLQSAADPSQNKSLFNTLYDLMSELKSGIRPSDDAITDIDTAMKQIESTRSDVGARLNTIERQQYLNEDYSIFSQENISRIEDLDMAEAISLLNQQLLTMQVLQQTYTRVSNLSMFSYL
ncbi:MAG: flagellar hook-associated protein FlgL [Gammaproteobacteria bacterium]|nr:flagellar hook-associated protein FlgL [Gammaproteobacteria bacterium]